MVKSGAKKTGKGQKNLKIKDLDAKVKSLKIKGGGKGLMIGGLPPFNKPKLNQ